MNAVMKKSVFLQPQKRKVLWSCLGGGIGRHAGLKIP